MSSLVLKWWYSDGGINYPSCRGLPPRWHRGLPNGAPQPHSDAGAEAEATGCWLNVADIDDFMVAQP